MQTAGLISGYVQLLLPVGHGGEVKQLPTHPLDAAPGNRACTESSLEMATYSAKTRQKQEAQESRGADQSAPSQPGRTESSSGRGFES